MNVSLFAYVFGCIFGLCKQSLPCPFIVYKPVPLVSAILHIEKTGYLICLNNIFYVFPVSMGFFGCDTFYMDVLTKKCVVHI